MLQIVDLHIHSKYSRACSGQLTLENIGRYCQTKGVDIVATGDFTHPAWFGDIQNKLEPAGQGLYKLKASSCPTLFVLGTEISCIYKKNDKVRRLHICVLAPSIETAQKINIALAKIGNLASDGRPILGLDAKNFLKICLDIDQNCFVFPAHIWTPWFALLGSKSGFDSVHECFEELTDRIFAVETGLSSDPAMNWRVPFLDNISLISNSDAHSLQNIAREANIFDLEKISYDNLIAGIKNKDKNKFLKTIEFYPEEGMYHFDGHRDCGVRLPPSQTAKQDGLCPVCRRPLTIGVLHRVEELAGRPEGFADKRRPTFIKLVELDKIIAQSLNIKSRQSVKVQEIYQKLVSSFKNELNILLNVSLSEVQTAAGEKIAEGLRRVRQGELFIEPGFDGQYGTVKIFSDSEKENKVKQQELF